MAGLSGTRPMPAGGPASPSRLERLVPGLNSVKRIELVVFSRMMATFIRAGVPILDGLEVVRGQSASAPFQKALDGVAADLRTGEPLSAAVARHPRIFPRLYVDMVVAAEATGELDTILDQLARYLEQADGTSRRIRQAMLYPSLVMGLAVVVVLILITFVLPSFTTLFQDFDAELPLPTQVMLGLGAFGGRWGLHTAAALVLLVGLALAARNRPVVRTFLDRTIIRLPVIGRLARLGIEARFTRMLGILLRAGVPIAQAFDISVQGTGNAEYIRRLGPVRDRLLAGEGIAVPLRSSGLFGPLLVQMVVVGEETGTLDVYLGQAADFLDGDLDYRTKQLVTLIEPLLIGGVALVVGFVALSVVTPMYSILRQIK
jgi:type IV pilus assembly protein PilC